MPQRMRSDMVADPVRFVHAARRTETPPLE
jgi:hypothetical protein